MHADGEDPERAFDAVESSVHRVLATIDSIEPPIDSIEPPIDAVEPLVHAVEPVRVFGLGLSQRVEQLDVLLMGLTGRQGLSSCGDGNVGAVPLVLSQLVHK
jgi:hypothetical protein